MAYDAAVIANQVAEAALADADGESRRRRDCP